MEYRTLGQCGLKVSVLGIGGWNTFGSCVTDMKIINNILTTAFEAGINYFDIADAYACGKAEVVMGKVLGDFPRNELVITSKLFFPMSDDVNDRGLSRKHIMESIEKSLKRIGTEYIDIYYCHRYDNNTPLEETARAMDDLVRQGKILYWGTSQWTVQQINKLLKICDAINIYKPQVEHPQYNLLFRSFFESELRPTAKDNGLGLVVWSPLASGLLTGKYDDGIPENSRLSRVNWLEDIICTENNLNCIRKLKMIADSIGVSRGEMSLAWIMSQPGVSCVVTGASNVKQLRENLGALEIDVTQEISNKINDIFPVNPERVMTW